ncbi:hypothetical protein GCM10009613_61420 [Pseudonocardia kongjuensis]|uniref:Uncharacterized protein n=1 Tax=Pseudonocardia kongjuensis TaxID=102227 RepID=A0ABP4J0P4_9PSEU
MDREDSARILGEFGMNRQSTLRLWTILASIGAGAAVVVLVLLGVVAYGQQRAEEHLDADLHRDERDYSDQ